MQKRCLLRNSWPQGELGILMMKPDGNSFLQLEQADFLIGLVGLNELVQNS